MNTASTPRGRLVLVPAPLDFGVEAQPLEALLPLGVVQAAARISHWVVENPKTARALLKRVDALAPLALPLQQQALVTLPQPRKGSQEAITEHDWRALLAPALAGHDVGLLSEAGLPAVADPGAQLVAAAHAMGIAVWPLAGASAIPLALAASGLGGQHFAFVGYLPQEAAQRSRRIAELEQRSLREGQTQIAIETPYRNRALLQALLAALAPSTRLAVACALTAAGGWCQMRSVQQWRSLGEAAVADASFERRPAVFVWQA